MYVDTAIFMYALGSESPYREPCARILSAGATGSVVLTTSAETLQEILHRYHSIGRDEDIRLAFDAVAASVRRILPVTGDDLQEARRLGDRIKDRRVSARDLLHAAVARRHGLGQVLTTDKGFAGIPGIAPVDPLRWSPAG